MNLPFFLKKSVFALVIGLISLFLIRVLFYYVNTPENPEYDKSTLLAAFVMGFRFDLVILSYITSLHFLLLFIVQVFSKNDLKKILKGILISHSILIGLALLLGIINIPYFKQFNSHLTMSAFSWTENLGFVFSMILQDSKHVLFIIFALFFLFLFFWVLKRIKFFKIQPIRISIFPQLIYFVLGALFIFIGIRGRFSSKSPIRWGTAFFSSYQFPNQLGLNPNFTLLRSYLDKKKLKTQYSKDEKNEIMNRLKQDIGVSFDEKNELIYRKIVNNSGVQTKKNVVIVLMESMSSYYLSYFGQKKELTPVLDSLILKSRFYPNFYSSGIHTFNGISSTLTGLPAPMDMHPMKRYVAENRLISYPKVFQENGYSNSFFCTHDAQFDNIGGYTLNIGFDVLISQKDFKSSEVLSTLGVPDHVLFNRAIKTFNNGNKPFFSVILSGSNHTPYIIPENVGFENILDNDDDGIVAYADWSIGQFLHEAKEYPWYNNTIFVFLGDHGRPLRPKYEMALNHNHTSMIIHSPGDTILNGISNAIGSQIDLLPTLLDMLNVSYNDYGLGQSLESKPNKKSTYFSADHQFAFLNDSVYYIQHQTGKEFLHKYRLEKVNAVPELLELYRKDIENVKNRIEYSKMVNSR